MAKASAFNLLPLNDTPMLSFSNKNEEDELQQFCDASFAEELQFEEALKASLLSSQLPTSGPSSSLGFCEGCRERKENDQLKNSDCGQTEFAEELQFEEALKASLLSSQLPTSGPSSSLGFCEGCRERKENDQLKNGDCGQTAFAEELQFEEALKASLLSSQLPTSGPSSSLGFCEGCRERKENDQLKNGDCGQTAFAEELQFEEALKTSLLSSQFPTSGPSSSLGFCKGCRERKEYDQLKNGDCGHPVCFDCLRNYEGENIKTGRKIVACPGFSCNYVLKFDTYKHLPSKYTSIRREKAPSMEPTPNFSCSKNLYKKMGSENVKQTVHKRKYEEATASDTTKKTIDDDDDDDDSDNSDEDADTDDYESDACPRSPETCKKSKWFKKFIKGLEYLSNEGEMSDPNRQWHCPACRGGAGAIKQYLGLRTLIQHAKTKGSTRVRLHRELAQLLEEMLQSKAASAISSAKWKGLKEDKKDQEIVWPPMVVIVNTIYKRDENNKWIGITNKQLKDMFSSYDAIVKAQQSYNYKGHCGMSMLIFESSARGYLEAERLHKHFTEEGTDRNAWNCRPLYFLPTGERQLYGYLALKEDVDHFNSISSKAKIKYEMRWYQEMVVNQIRQMSDDNLQQNRVQAINFEESYNTLNEKLQMAKKEMEVMRRKVTEQHQQDMEEMEFQEQFYKDQIRNILESRKVNDGDLESTQEEEDQGNEKEEEAESSKLIITKTIEY